jgi:hypothetical protein
MAELPVPPLQAEALLAVLAGHGVDFIVIGGFSLAAHGVVRGTKDVDVVPDPARENLESLSGALEDLEAQVLLADDFDPRELGVELDAAGLALGGNWALRTRLGRLDVMQDVPGMVGYPALRDASIEIDVAEAGRLPFAGLDDLIAMKAAAGRPQDEIDIASLEDARRRR